MSHSTVLVIGPKTEEELTAALAPFDENIEVEQYIDETKEQQIAARRQKHAQAAENLRKYQAGEPPYDRPIFNEGHRRWIEEEAPAEAALDDAALWAVILEKESWNDRDADGNVLSTYNPKSKWDWYSVGGRWDGSLVAKEPAAVAERMPLDHYPDLYGTPDQRPAYDGMHTNFVERLDALDLEQTSVTFAVLTPDGQWHENGRMGWWGMVADEKEPDQWAAQWNDLVAAHADQPAWLVDVHI